MDRLVLGEVVPLFFGSTLLFTSLVLAGGELLRLAEYLQNGESLMLVGRLFLLTIPGMLNLTFPMAMLLASLMGFERLSGNSEIVALTAAGVRFERIVVPVAVFALVVALAGLWFSNSVVPASSQGRNRIIEDVKRGGGNGLFSVGQLTAPLRNADGSLHTLVHVEGGANLINGEMTNVSVELWKEGRVTTVFYAPRARWITNTKEWTLENWRSVYFEGNTPGIFEGNSLETREKKVPLDTPEQLSALLEGRAEDIETRELARRARLLRDGKNLPKAREYEVEIARRNALPFASFCFAMIGTPLGVSRQRGPKGAGFGWSVVITFAYWVGLQTTSIMARGGALPADVALAIPNLLCAGVGLYLIRRVLR
ncbi:MAG: LptF/LptG family permease [Capsulimonadales bacterium]|nr:LptF/LptG family permease [Capsulimonadales bacterium]